MFSIFLVRIIGHKMLQQHVDAYTRSVDRASSLIRAPPQKSASLRPIPRNENIQEVDRSTPLSPGKQLPCYPQKLILTHFSDLPWARRTTSPDAAASEDNARRYPVYPRRKYPESLHGVSAQCIDYMKSLSIAL